MPWLGFRLRILLFLLLVSLPPLVAFGAATLVGTTSLQSQTRDRLVADALTRAVDAIDAEVGPALSGAAVVAGDAVFAAAVVEADAPAAARLFEASAPVLRGWQAMVTSPAGTSLPLSVPPATGDTLALMQRVAEVHGSGAVLVDGELWTAVATPLLTTVPGARDRILVAWHPASALAQAMLPSAGGAAIRAGQDEVAFGSQAAAAAAALDAVRAPDFTGLASLPLADGRPARLAIAIEPIRVGIGPVGLATLLAFAGAGAILLAVLLAVLLGGVIGRALRSMTVAADRVRGGDFSTAPGRGGSDELSRLASAQQRLAASLEERNRQINELAVRVSAAPITDDARAVAGSVVAAAQSVTGDATWSLAVLGGSDALLPPGVYGPNAPGVAPDPIGDLHQWAAVTSDAAAPGRRARHLIGPWGAFVVVDVAASDELRAILFAPWEGRPSPSSAELDLFSLLGQHAATAIEHALLYTRLRAQTDELNRMAAVQTDFLRGVTHDLQTPLTSIRALASELQRTDDLDAAARIDLETIAQQADRLRRMVGQLLAVSRLEVGALTPRQEVFHAEPVVRRTWDALRATEHLFALEMSGLPHLVVADPDRLEQVLWAVLDNAVKYSPPGSVVRVRITAVSAASVDGLTAEIAISDAGPGMDAATRNRAFEQFFRADSARRAAPDGSGVGLYAARGLVEAMGGTIRLGDAAGGGTTVVIALPAEAAEERAGVPA